jgi:hypothetical protein
VDAIASSDYSYKSANKNPITSRSDSGSDRTRFLFIKKGQLRRDALVLLRRLVMNWKSSTLITLLCLFPVLSAVAIGPEHSGSWYWDEQSGHGFSIEIGELPDGSPLGVAYWYTYDNKGNPIFMVGNGVPDGDILDVVFESPVGMIFGEFDPLTVSREDGGTGRFVFTDENIATFQYTPSDFTVANWGHSPIAFMPLTKLFGIPVSDSPELSALESRIEELEGLLADVSRLIDPNTGYDTVRFEGVNVQIVNGSGTTDGETSGTGNLIIGYNELRETPGEPVDCSDRWVCDYRGGSHMLVIGERNNYTSDSHGGMVVGNWNETSAPFASVSGGANNTASGEAASVLGGNANTASGGASSVSGGGWGTASGEYASVSGGSQNRASGVAASASGGNTNTASGVLATVSGGFGNKASGANSSVSGGDHRTAPGDEDWAAGGLFQDW